MTYMYQWFGVMTGWAFMSGCVLGVMSLATRQPMRPAQIPPTKTEQQQRGRELSR